MEKHEQGSASGSWCWITSFLYIFFEEYMHERLEVGGERWEELVF